MVINGVEYHKLCRSPDYISTNLNAVGEMYDH